MNPSETLEFYCSNCKANVDAELRAIVEVLDQHSRLVRTTTTAVCPHCGCHIDSDSDYPSLGWSIKE